MTKSTIYTVVLDGVVTHTGHDKTHALNLAKTASGFDIRMSIADADVYESKTGIDPKLIWSVRWESSGPLEPNVFADSPSLAPAV